MQADLDAYLASMTGPAPSAKELARIVSDGFAEERRAMKALIDGQLRAIRGAMHDGTPSAPLVADPLSTPNHTPSNVPPSGHDPNNLLGGVSTTSISAILNALAPRASGFDLESRESPPPDRPSAVTIAAPTSSVSDEDDERYDVSPLPQLFPTTPPTALTWWPAIPVIGGCAGGRRRRRGRRRGRRRPW